MSLTMEERFMKKVLVTPDCWIWIGSKYYYSKSPQLYGHIQYEGRVQPAHRVAHLLWIGPIPYKYDVDHLCRHTLCVNPKHLEAVPHRVNVIERGQGPFANRAKQTHCIRGHEFTPENTYIHKSRGVRVCKTCHRERNRAIGRANETPDQRTHRLAYHKALRETPEHKAKFNAYRRERRRKNKP
jgi:hypothetical protein